MELNTDLLDHVQMSVGQGGGLQLQIVELEQADLGIQILETGHRDLDFCSFILFNWNTKDLGTLWGKVYYVIAPCFVNFLRTIRTNYGSNILVPKCPIQSKMLFSMIFSKMIFSLVSHIKGKSSNILFELTLCRSSAATLSRHSFHLKVSI